jgi:hypothetical protein
VIGDALVPRKASHAIAEGRAAADAIVGGHHLRDFTSTAAR